MVQLNTTYDKQLKEKIFVLKGDEGYARTTDVIATLITDFSDYDTHISTCHVGLEIEVLREFGDSTLEIYVDGEVTTIPWSHENMATIIDSTWNDRGVYWENGKLLIGKLELYPLVETGLYLQYDVEHTINVRYNGNKQCLGSNAKPIVFTVPMPDTFKSTLTFTSPSQRYAPTTEINDIEISFSGEHSSLEEKPVSIYLDNIFYDTVSLRPNGTSETLELTGLTDGLHTLTAVFDGDDEFYASQTEYQISIGYKITNLEYSPYIIQGDSGYLSCTVLDYLNEPFVGLGLSVVEDNGGWQPISSDTNQTDSYGSVTIEPVYYSSREFAISTGTWYSERHTTNIINPTSLSMNLGSQYVTPNSSTTITGAVYSNGSIIPVGGIGITFISTDVDGDEFEWNAVTGSDGKYSTTTQTDANGKVEIVGLIDNSLVSNRVYLDVLSYWWDTDDNKQYGYIRTNNIPIIKTSKGYKFENPNRTNGIVAFEYNRVGKWVVEFDLVDIQGAFDYIKFDGRDIFDTQYVVLTPSPWRIEHDADNTLRWYVDNVLWQTYNYGDRAFVIELNYGSIIVDNLRIERIE